MFYFFIFLVKNVTAEVTIAPNSIINTASDAAGAVSAGAEASSAGVVNPSYNSYLSLS
jgi:hypothetical protein